jgi:hypothetical protein
MEMSDQANDLNCPRRGKAKWDCVAELARREAERYSDKYKTPPTLRQLYYLLLSRRVIKSSQNEYRQLSIELTRRRLAGEFPWELMDDRTRRVSNLAPETYMPDRDDLANNIRKQIDDITGRILYNPWDDQPTNVIITLEKEAAEPVLDKFLREFYVPFTARGGPDGEAMEYVYYIGVNQLHVIRGFDSTTDKYAIAVQVKELQSRGHYVRILHYGDFDPSGEYIFKDLIDKVTGIGRKIGVDPRYLQFEKVAVNPVDIVRLNLPPEPVEKKSTNIRRWWSKRIKELTTQGSESYDPYAVELVGKLKNPNNTESIQVELDALTAVNPEYLEKLTLNKLREVFDWNIYESLTRPKVEEVYERRGEVLRKLEGNLPKLFEGVDLNF